MADMKLYHIYFSDVLKKGILPATDKTQGLLVFTSHSLTEINRFEKNTESHPSIPP